MRPSRFVAVALTAAFALVACGGDTEEGGTVQIDVSTEAGVKPTFDVPTGQEPPQELVVETVREGDGDTAGAGDDVVVQYVGKGWSRGEQFDASWDKGDTFSFQLGAGRVIPGWDEGVAGMRVGERRLLIIPPDLAYGASGGGPIGPNETLVFVVDLIEVR